MKWICLLLTAAMLLTGCSAHNDPAAASAPAQGAELISQAAEQTAAPALQGTSLMEDERFLNMLPILDSLLRAMDGGRAYAPQDAGFVWDTLYSMGASWGYTYPDVDISSQVTAPSSAMVNWMQAAFAPLEQLPELPASHAIGYDAAGDLYTLEPSGLGDTVTRLEEALLLEDGTVSARLGLYQGDGTRLKGVRFTLIEDADACNVCDPIYYYRVAGAAAE